jgi:hypothetical protein
LISAFEFTRSKSNVRNRSTRGEGMHRHPFPGAA